MKKERYGIECWDVDEYCSNGPNWGVDNEFYTTKKLIYSGGHHWYSWPLSTVEAIELVGDIEYFVEEFGDGEEQELFDSLTGKTDFSWFYEE